MLHQINPIPRLHVEDVNACASNGAAIMLKNFQIVQIITTPLQWLNLNLKPQSLLSIKPIEF